MPLKDNILVPNSESRLKYPDELKVYIIKQFCECFQGRYIAIAIAAKKSSDVYHAIRLFSINKYLESSRTSSNAQAEYKISIIAFPLDNLCQEFVAWW